MHVRVDDVLDVQTKRAPGSNNMIIHVRTRRDHTAWMDMWQIQAAVGQLYVPV